MGRYSDQHLADLRRRMSNDILTTLGNFGVVEMMTPMGLHLLVESLTEDGMHPLEKMAAELRNEELILGRNRDD